LALLAQSTTWPIHIIRALLEQAQLLYLWQFVIPDKSGVLDLNMKFLVQSITVPGRELDHESYSVGGQENYRLTQERRGGVVTANFVEIEGSFVDQFFRDWLDQVSPPSTELSVQSGAGATQNRYRGSIGRGGLLEGYHRTASVYVYGRDESIQSHYMMMNLVPKKVGEYELSYENSGIKTVPVQMLCDEVRRVT